MNSGSSAFIGSGAHASRLRVDDRVVPAVARHLHRHGARRCGARPARFRPSCVPGICSAASTFAFSAMRLPPRRPSSAVITSLLPQSAMRSAIECGAKPPNTTDVDRADARAGEHRHGRFGNHRQVDRDAVALAHAEVAQRVGEPADARVQFAIADALGGQRRVVAFEDQRGLVAARRPGGGPGN